MRRLRMILMALLLVVPLAATVKAQVVAEVGVGPAIVAVPEVYGPPACEWGYYAYYPYACAPYGYYGPDWFYGGFFIGAGPWYHWGWRGRGWGYGGVGYRGAYAGRGGYGFAGRGGYVGRAPYAAGGYRGGNTIAPRVYGGGSARGFSSAPRGGVSSAPHSFSSGGGGHFSGGGGGHFGGGGGHGGGHR
jgi:hypothetical protein